MGLKTKQNKHTAKQAKTLRDNALRRIIRTSAFNYLSPGPSHVHVSVPKLPACRIARAVSAVQPVCMTISAIAGLAVNKKGSACPFFTTRGQFAHWGMILLQRVLHSFGPYVIVCLC